MDQYKYFLFHYVSQHHFQKLFLYFLDQLKYNRDNPKNDYANLKLYLAYGNLTNIESKEDHLY